MEFSLVLKKKVHSTFVNAISFHPLDSNLVVSGSSDNKTILSSVKDGKVVWENDELKAHVSCVGFNRNGKWVAGGGENGRLVVMDANNGKSYSVIDVSSWINSLAFRSDNKIVCGLDNGIIVLVNWQLPSKSVETTIQLDNESICSIAAISPLSDDWVMVGDYGGTKLISIYEEKVIRKNENYCSHVRSLGFNEDGSKFVLGGCNAGGRHGTARLYSMDQLNPMMKFEGHSSAVQFVGFLHDDERLITCSWDDTIKYWDVHSGKCLLTTKANGSVYCGVVSKDEKYTAIGCEDGSIEFYSCPARPVYSLDNKVVLTFC